MTRRSTVHRQIYFYLLVLLAAAQPLSIYATTILQFLLLFNWIVEGEFRTKFQRLRINLPFWIFSVFFLLHILGLAWSSDMHYGLQDLKIKLPIIFIPFLIVSSGAPELKETRIILVSFISGCIVASFASILALLNVIEIDLSDFRNASLFISHIRFSLMIVLSIMFAAYLLFVKEEGEPTAFRLLYIIALAWLPVFLVILRSLSGIIILLGVIFLISILLSRKVPDRAGRFMITVFIVMIPLFGIIYIGNAIERFYSVEEVNPEELDEFTLEGNRYIHKLENKEIENGNYVWLYVCPEELKREWSRVSDLDYSGKTENGGFVKFTLIRYLTSKGLRKDAAGIRQLNSTDIDAIEKGLANHIFLNRFALYPRVYEVIWEFDRYRLGYDPNDKSLVQRYYYLKAGLSIASEHLLFGVGTGDVRQSFDRYYTENDSPLRMERRRRAHNQYLTLAIAFGIPGLIICLLALGMPVSMNRRWSSFMTIVFFLTMTLSMLDEDTLENTPGAVMFGFFYALFVFGERWTWLWGKR